MGCNYDEGCYLLSEKYKDYGLSIASDLDDAVNIINDAIKSISSFDIPNDYIGSKVRESIQKINGKFDIDTINITSFVGDVTKFTGEKSAMHQKHYKNWKEMQETDDNDKSETKESEK